MLFLLLLVRLTAFAEGSILDSYNVVWNSQSLNASESMPVGGGDVGLNVWVESDEVLFYVGRSGTFDENNQMLKLGRVRLKFDPNPFSKNAQFHQELVLRDGSVIIRSRHPEGWVATLRIWVEVSRPVVHVVVDSSTSLIVTASYEGWRNQARKLPADCRRTRFPCMSLVGYPGDVTLYPDKVGFRENSVLWYHRNRGDDLVVGKELEQQGLGEFRGRIWNPLADRTFGGLLTGRGMVPAGKTVGTYAGTAYSAWHLKSQKARKKQGIQVLLHTGQSPTLEQWEEGLARLAKEADSDKGTAWERNRKWWRSFWQRSHVFINSSNPDPADEAWQIGRSYQLYRYLLACNAYGEWPTKFNGSFFTYDPLFVESQRGVKSETPDYRTWGGGSFTAQNQRLVYWPMLKNGDFDMMQPQFDFYRRALPTAELRTRAYWGHEGASFTEQLENFGLPVGSLYGWIGSKCRWGDRDPEAETGVQSIGVVHQFGHQLDFAFMILEYHRFSGLDISPYLRFIDSAVKFFDQHYQYRLRQRENKVLDSNGHLVIYPSRACETYVNARNPADVISGLRAVLTRLLSLPEGFVSDAEKEKYRLMLGRVPPLPVRRTEDGSYLAGAESWSRFAVGEIPELYSVFPYGLFAVGKPGFDLARATWDKGLRDRQKNRQEPWYQGGIFAARLGFLEDARQTALFKLKDSGERFPVFWQTDDWAPDHNWLGAGMIGLQEMLLQTVGEKILLLPCWPAEWEVDFKLHAPGTTTVEGHWREGQFLRLRTKPSKREKDLVIGKGL